MILLDAIVQVLALPDADWFRVSAAFFLQSADHIAGNDGFPVGLAAVNHYALRTTMPLNGFCEEPLGCSNVPMLAESESTVSPTLSMAR